MPGHLAGTQADHRAQSLTALTVTTMYASSNRGRTTFSWSYMNISDLLYNRFGILCNHKRAVYRKGRR